MYHPVWRTSRNLCSTLDSTVTIRYAFEREVFPIGENSKVNRIMIKISMFYTKVITKSILFWITVLVSILLTIMTATLMKMSVFQYIESSYPVYIVMNLFVLVSTSSLIHKNTDILSYLERDPLEKQIQVFLSILLIIGIFSLLPITLLIIIHSPLVGMNFLLIEIIHFLMIWLLSNAFAAAIGVTVSTVFKNEWSVILSILVYVFVLVTLHGEGPDRPIYRFMNLFGDQTFISTNHLAGVLSNASYYMDKLFVVLVIVSMILLNGILLSKKKRLKWIVAEITCLAMLIMLVNVANQNNQLFTYEYESLEVDAYKVDAYDMDITLGSRLKSQVTMQVEFFEKSNTLQFLLDDIFLVSSIKINDELADFTHDNHTLTINGIYNASEKVSVVIDYKGSVNVLSEIGFDTFYVTRTAVNLPDDQFYWYPKLPTMEASKYQAHIVSKAPLYSNLAIEKKSKDEYILTGDSTGISVFAGMYKTVENAGILYVLPVDHHSFDRLSNYLNLALEERLSDVGVNHSLTDEQRATLEMKKYKQVIVGIWPSGDVTDVLQVYEDTVLLRYDE